MSAGTRYDVVGRKGDTKGFDGAPDRELVECRVGYRVSVAGRGSMACTGRRLNLGGAHGTHLITDWERGSRGCFSFFLSPRYTSSRFRQPLLPRVIKNTCTVGMASLGKSRGEASRGYV